MSVFGVDPREPSGIADLVSEQLPQEPELRRGWAEIFDADQPLQDDPRHLSWMTADGL